MSFLQRLRHNMLGALARAAGVTSDDSRLWRTADGSALPRSKREWARTFNRSSVLRGPVARISEDCATVDWCLTQKTKERMPDGRYREVEVFEHPLLDLWNRPDPDLSGAVFRFLVFAYWELAGENFFLRRPDPSDPLGRPRELWIIPPWDVEETPSVANGATWRVRLGGKTHGIPVGEILWLRRPNVENPRGRGVGAVAAVDDEVTQSELMRKFNNSTFANSARPDVIVGVPGLDAKQVPRLRAQWLRDHGGKLNRGIPAFINSETKVSLLTHSHQDLEFSEGTKLNRDFIAQNWQMPPELLGILENSNRATVDAALRIYQRNIIRPRVNALADELAAWLLPLFGDPTLKFRPRNPVEEAVEFILEQATQGLQAGAVTINEWRERNGFQPIAGGDVLLIPTNNVEMVAVGKKPVMRRGGSSRVRRLSEDGPENPDLVDLLLAAVVPSNGNGGFHGR